MCVCVETFISEVFVVVSAAWRHAVVVSPVHGLRLSVLMSLDWKTSSKTLSDHSQSCDFLLHTHAMDRFRSAISKSLIRDWG